jgi:hypothetical protein
VFGYKKHDIKNNPCGGCGLGLCGWFLYCSQIEEIFYLAVVETIKLFDNFFCASIRGKAVSAKLLCKTNHPAA